MQKQHQQLHTQEKILRYELAQKRKLLTELKEELEYCREKWLQAREKNSSTQAQWTQLRNEFASRKNAVHDDINNSVESGYSDERGSSTDEEEPGYETDISESHKISSPETVSEQIDVNLASEGTNDEEDIIHVIRDQIQEIESSSAATPAEASSLPGETMVLTLDNASSVAQTEDTALGSDGKLNKQLDQIQGEEGFVANSSKATPIPEEPSVSMSENASLVAQNEDTALEKDERLKRLDQIQEIEASASTNLSQASPLRGEPTKPSSRTSDDDSPNDEILKRLDQTEDTETSLMLPLEVSSLPGASSANSLRAPPIPPPLPPAPEVFVFKKSSKAKDVALTREERLKRLEEQTKQLMSRVSETASKRVSINAKLDNLHQIYGESSGAGNSSSANDCNDSVTAKTKPDDGNENNV